MERDNDVVFQNVRKAAKEKNQSKVTAGYNRRYVDSGAAQQMLGDASTQMMRLYDTRASSLLYSASRLHARLP